MAYTTDTRSAGLGQRIANLRVTLADRVAKNKIYRSTYNELQALTDRDLADLGISRSMIKRIAIEVSQAR
ncbi:DUF1127 domain-containing protein [Limimaricola cinnabarinus]|jgi:uncharacterized protein YjiS (DUF1127 family)|uniref:YjiS-like domain-containing protein n=1 Tax=Limimaricola cinnabarinus TaxID=1125964 RepID=A0A2G1ML53_9RHOB|nr:DUF1127 domain-containing protein [Limimaricola cinnabarinus]PHP29417.1 hypothetical protein CJ301_02840 [Limimaricola cinnabarinus]